jgi:hypothetical protein
MRGGITSLGLLFRSHLKNRILGQNRGGAVFQAAGILQYFEDLKQGTNPAKGGRAKGIFEITSNSVVQSYSYRFLPPRHHLPKLGSRLNFISRCCQNVFNPDLVEIWITSVY